MSVDPLTCLEIDLDALEHNYHFLRSRLKPETNFLGVVKAYAYGSDSIAIARKLEELGADYLAVAFTREGIHLREAGIGLPILVLHPQPADLKFLAKHCLEPNLYSPRLLKLYLKEADETGLKHYPVHLEFNTGLNRVGFWENDVDWIAEALEGTSAIEICSVFSHLAASDDSKARDFTLRQIESFAAIVREVTAKLPGRPFKHLLNTSGVLNYPEGQWDMVRCGIGLYGYGNAQEFDEALRPVARLRTHISQLHLIEPGEYVGYNMGYQSPNGGKIATLPVGHADGIGRQYGQERGSFIISGQRAPIIGNVCMDMVMVEVSGIPCNEGDQALFFGPEISAETQASQAGTISYELLTGISQRIRREIIGG